MGQACHLGNFGQPLPCLPYLPFVLAVFWAWEGIIGTPLSSQWQVLPPLFSKSLPNGGAPLQGYQLLPITPLFFTLYRSLLHCYLYPLPALANSKLFLP